MNDTTSSDSNRETSAGPFATLGQKPNSTTEPPPQASDVGTLLCATRMRLGKDLQDIAAVLHIRYNFLVAIEDGRYEDLPGQAYAIGFVRAYADNLGLDGDEVVRRYKEETAGVKRVTRYEYPIPAPESGIPSGALLMIAVVLGMVVYGVWYSMADADRRAADVIQEVPDRLAAMLKSESPAEPEPEVTQQQVAEATASPDAGSEFVPSVAEDEETPPAAPAVEISSTAKPVMPMPAAPQVAEVPQPKAPSQSTAPIVQTQAPQVIAQPAAPPPATPLPAKVPEKAPEKVATTVAATPPAASPAPATTPAQVAVAPVQTKLQQPAASPVDANTPPTAVPAPKAPVVTAAAVKPPPAAATPPAKPNAQIAAAGKSAVELRAKSDSWIQVRDGEQLLLTRFLRKGETYKVPDRSGLTLMTLNAGGIEIMVDGQLMPPLGDPGSVARGVLLDAAKLKAMPKPAAAPAVGVN
jgi:cytoskeleton protein RodZ